MKNVRLRFKKEDECRYISHLDLVRCMNRAVKKSKLPIWYTEGFNPHPLLSFPLPLSLGMEGERECLDVKLEDMVKETEIISKLNENLPQGIRITEVNIPVKKAKDIAFALYELKITSENDEINVSQIAENLQTLLKMEEIIVEKKTKSGQKNINISPDIQMYIVGEKDNYVKVRVALSAGSEKNINPNLLVKAFEDYFEIKIYAKIKRLELFDKSLNVFE